MPVPPGIRAGRARTLEWLRASEWKRRAADGGAVVPGTGRGAPGMHNTTTEPIRRSRAVLRMHGMRHTARPAQLPSIAVLRMLREPPRAGEPPPPRSRCPPSDPIRPKTRTHAENDRYGRWARMPAWNRPTTPPGTDARRNGIAATARSASLPRLTGLPQFHPEDVERSETQNRHGALRPGISSSVRRSPAGPSAPGCRPPAPR